MKKRLLSVTQEENGMEKWENLLVPDNALKQENRKRQLRKNKRKRMRKDFYLPEIEDLSICPIVPRYPPGARAYICGVASVKVLGLTIHGITIKHGQKGYFINMPQYRKQMDIMM